MHLYFCVRPSETRLAELVVLPPLSLGLPELRGAVVRARLLFLVLVWLIVMVVVEEGAGEEEEDEEEEEEEDNVITGDTAGRFLLVAADDEPAVSDITGPFDRRREKPGDFLRLSVSTISTLPDDDGESICCTLLMLVDKEEESVKSMTPTFSALFFKISVSDT